MTLRAAGGSGLLLQRRGFERCRVQHPLSCVDYQAPPLTCRRSAVRGNARTRLQGRPGPASAPVANPLRSRDKSVVAWGR